ncbi:glycosyltransferase family 4 protein [Methanoculleus oceani]|uniref:Glycosyl transferase group 1 n=1 Tax=Methanoculleus oceani TaxID=2184756 RepID=A0ABD4TBL6_9EURY|nr:glycosyltransferase family 4 protein [Methanoculleus sp. CWC-02]MCM2466076.1 hypothetical protein [Methanoculleus sp. CWC-02]
MKVCLLTTVHQYNDQRIFFKEARSLVKQFPVTLIAPDESGWSKTVDDVSVVTVKRASSKLLHFVTVWRVFVAGLRIDCSVVHCHEPSSLLVSVLLKALQGKQVVYDSHEHYGSLLASDPLFPQPIKGFIRTATDIFERLLIPFVDAVITVDEDLAGKYRHFGHKNVSIVANYPQLDIFDSIPASDHGWDLVYVGGISNERGIFQMIEAAERTNCSLACIGHYVNLQNEETIKKYIQERGCSNVHIIGWRPQPDVISAIKSSKICFSLLHPSPVWDTAVPVKLLEYMSCGKPVIASDLPGISSVVESAECGLTVNPSDVDSIVTAVQYLMENPQAATAMAENGRRITKMKYNWSVAEGVLYDVMGSLAH